MWVKAQECFRSRASTCVLVVSVPNPPATGGFGLLVATRPCCQPRFVSHFTPQVELCGQGVGGTFPWG